MLDVPIGVSGPSRGVAAPESLGCRHSVGAPWVSVLPVGVLLVLLTVSMLYLLRKSLEKLVWPVLLLLVVLKEVPDVLLLLGALLLPACE